MKAVASVAVAVLSFGLAATASAQTPERVRGVVESLHGDTLTVKSRSGADVRVALAPGWRAVAVLPGKIEQIRPGSFIGAAASGPPDNLRATEVVVFPAAMRGIGEGHYAWDLAPGSSMTNGNVDGEVSAADGRHLTVSYKGGSVKMTVPPDVPVVTLTRGDRAMVAPGAKVFIPGRREAGGTVTASRVLVGTHGMTPPM